MGIRAKALLAVVLLVLVPSLFLAVVAYQLREDVADTARENTVRYLENQIRKDIIKLNSNASECIENYLGKMEVLGESAGFHIGEHLGSASPVADVVWGSKYLLEQVNRTALRKVMDGEVNDRNYTAMVGIAGKDRVDAALEYFFENLTMDYSNSHVNESAYSAFNEVNEILMDNGSHAMYDFLYSMLLPEERKKLDYIMSAGGMLYSFRSVPEMLWSYFASEDSGFIVLIPYDARFSPLFNPHVRNWYEKAKDAGKPIWSDAYVDEITKKPMVTYSVPVYEGEKLLGVAGFDLLLSTLEKKTEEFLEPGNGFAFTVCRNGSALTYPDERMLGKSLTMGDGGFNMSVREMLNNTAGSANVTVNGKEAFLAYSTVDNTEWKFATVVYYDVIYEEAGESADEIGGIIEMKSLYLLMILLSVGLITFIAAFFTADSFLRDVKRLTRIADEVSRGNFDVNLDIGAKDELGDLERSIKRMVNSIKVAMKELEKGEK